IAPAAEFFAAAPVDYFPPPAEQDWHTWCDSEILGIRSTLNGVPIHKPVYFCRNPFWRERYRRRPGAPPETWTGKGRVETPAPFSMYNWKLPSVFSRLDFRGRPVDGA